MQKTHDDSFEDDVPENESIPSPQKEVDVEDEEVDVENEAGEEVGDDSHYAVGDYHITSSPADLIVDSICHQIEIGVIRIPRFQRAFVWDKKRASRFIESLALGLPVPQLFVLQTKLNQWEIIDGQQRLMSIFLFRKGVFPKKKCVVELHAKITDKSAGGAINTPGAFDDEENFGPFRLDLPKGDLDGLDFQSLEEKNKLSLKAVRIVVVKPDKANDRKAAYEIFSRLNTGGIKLSPQQVRLCVHESEFLAAVEDMNRNDNWRALLGGKMLSPTNKDSELILRSFALLDKGEKIVAGTAAMGAMPRFLDSFAGEMCDIGGAKIALASKLFRGFVKQCKGENERIFLGKESKKFSLPLFEAAFCASLKGRFSGNASALLGQVDFPGIYALREDDEFEQATRSHTTHPDRVKTRLDRAYALIKAI